MSHLQNLSIDLINSILETVMLLADQVLLLLLFSRYEDLMVSWCLALENVLIFYNGGVQLL